MSGPAAVDQRTTTLGYQPRRSGSVFSCIEKDASSTAWPRSIDAWLASPAPALGTLTSDGWWDQSNQRMPSLVLLRVRAPSISSELIVEMYDEGRGDRRFDDLRALLTAFRHAGACAGLQSEGNPCGAWFDVDTDEQVKTPVAFRGGA